jgi:hypothetical protein
MRILESVVLMSVVAACAAPTSEPFPEDAFVTGPIEGPQPPGTRIAMLWPVNDGEDYLYKFGGGPADGGRFAISFDGEIPSDALLSEGWGVAYIALVSSEIEDFTKIDDEAEFDALGIRGLDVDHAILFRGAGSNPSDAWAQTFPDGLSCGVCRRFEEGNDELTPTTCDALSVKVGDDLRPCNLD